MLKRLTLNLPLLKLNRTKNEKKIEKKEVLKAKLLEVLKKLMKLFSFHNLQMVQFQSNDHQSYRCRE